VATIFFHIDDPERDDCFDLLVRGHITIATYLGAKVSEKSKVPSRKSQVDFGFDF
jgi:hypothetical protein